ncbi:MAG: branched-chain amino acid transport system II carrier protein [Parachlamydiaceae bacterium]|nr:branched-chain amino acid transport system II carrier protein [Parachlamydiaceae bacterium]
MNPLKNKETIGAGLAIFSMFFGAGNIIYPLALGSQALDKIPSALLGLLLTAVIIPFLGLFAIFLYRGNVQEFFGRMGKRTGLLVALLIISLLGPFGSTPRCIALAYSTLKMSFPSLSAAIFSAVACIIIFFFAYKKNRLLDLLGYVLTPFLVICLAIIIFKGLFSAPDLTLTNESLSHMNALWYGLHEGYNTMDLLAAFFFAPVIISSMQRKVEGHQEISPLRFALQASLIGAFLLSVIYIGFGYLAYYYTSQIGHISSDQLLAAISLHVLGEHGGIIVSITVVLACLTTAIALIAAFTEFMYKEVLTEKIKYNHVMIGALVLTFFISTFEFQGISRFLSPILQICYPALIILTIANVTQQLYQIISKKKSVLEINEL